MVSSGANRRLYFPFWISIIVCMEKLCSKCKSAPQVWKGNPWCRECNRKANYERHAKTRYGLTRTQIDEMRENVGYRCEICEREEKTLTRQLHIDHCHESGKIRGMLCVNCNVALGNAKDSIEILELMIRYLRKHK